MKKIYIAGKVTGLPFEHVNSKFQNNEIALKLAGFDPVNPIKVVNNPQAEWNQAMKQCITALMSCDAVYVLPCSQDSRGAKVELWLALNLAVPIFYELEQLKQWNSSLSTV